MCKALGEFEQALSGFAAGFEVGALAPADLAAALRSAGRIEKVAATLASLVAARMASIGARQPGGASGRAGFGGRGRHLGGRCPPGHRGGQGHGPSARAAGGGRVGGTVTPTGQPDRGARPPTRALPPPWSKRRAGSAWPSCKRSAPGPRPPTSTWRAGAVPPTRRERCAPIPMPAGLGTCTPRGRPEDGAKVMAAVNRPWRPPAFEAGPGRPRPARAA